MRGVRQPDDVVFGSFVGVALGLRRIGLTFVGRQASARAGREATKSRRVRVKLEMAALVVFLQQVLAEVAVKVAPNGVNMIGVVLRIIELHQETG